MLPAMHIVNIPQPTYLNVPRSSFAVSDDHSELMTAGDRETDTLAIIILLNKNKVNLCRDKYLDI